MLYKALCNLLLKHTIGEHFLYMIVGSNSARLIGQGGVPFVLTCFTDWQRSDPRNRYVALRKSLLLVLRNVANLSVYISVVLFS